MDDDAEWHAAAVSQDWQLLGKLIRLRRGAMGLKQDELSSHGGPSNGTVRSLEQGARSTYSPRTFAQIEVALGWPPGTAQRILDGDIAEPDVLAIPPVGVRFPASPDEGVLPTRRSELEIATELLSELERDDGRSEDIQTAITALRAALPSLNSRPRS